MITVRTASRRDIPVILGLLYDLGRPRPADDSEADAFRDLVRRYVSDDDKRILVAVLDDVKPVGMAAAVLLPRLNRHAPELYIPELVVAKPHRRAGAGRALLAACGRLARRNKCHRMRLESGNERGGSHAFYSSLGFEQTALSFSKDL